MSKAVQFKTYYTRKNRPLTLKYNHKKCDHKNVIAKKRWQKCDHKKCDHKKMWSQKSDDKKCNHIFVIPF